MVSGVDGVSNGYQSIGLIIMGSKGINLTVTLIHVIWDQNGIILTLVDYMVAKG